MLTWQCQSAVRTSSYTLYAYNPIASADTQPWLQWVSSQKCYLRIQWCTLCTFTNYNITVNQSCRKRRLKETLQSTLVGYIYAFVLLHCYVHWQCYGILIVLHILELKPRQWALIDDIYFIKMYIQTCSKKYSFNNCKVF